jgi:hypothetical protein
MSTAKTALDIAADRRHLQLMLADLLAMRSGASSFLQGADRLLFLRDCLTRVDDSWDERFTAQVATIESIGLASAEQRVQMGDKYAALVSNTLDSIEGLIVRQLEEVAHG